MSNQVGAHGLPTIWAPGTKPSAHSRFSGALWGAHHETYTSVPHDGVQLPPTQGHDRDMGTTQNTAAIYVRRSAVTTGNTEADAFSRSLAA